MKKTGKSALYSTIKSTIKKLGISTEDTAGIINYIKFMESNVETSQVTHTPKKVTSSSGNKVEEIILSLLSNDNETPYGIQDICKATGLRYDPVRFAITDLRASRKIKIVDWKAAQAGPSTLLFQVHRSPLRALSIVTREQGFDSVTSFMKNNGNLLPRGYKTPAPLIKLVEELGITMYPLQTGVGLVKGYKNADLKYILKQVDEEKTITKKKAKKAKKRKYTKRIKPEIVSATPEVVKDRAMGIFSIFKRKNSTSDLIKF